MYRSVEQTAMKDIAEYHRNLFKDKSVSFLRKNVLSAKYVFTKEARKLNRELGLRSINHRSKKASQI